MGNKRTIFSKTKEIVLCEGIDEKYDIHLESDIKESIFMPWRFNRIWRRWPVEP